MPRSIKFLLPLLALLVVGSAGVLAFSVIDSTRTIDPRPALKERSRRLPSLPMVGSPDAKPPKEEFLPITPQTAREVNASRPFLTGLIPPAPPYQMRLTAEDEDRAIACLATAALFEAGVNSADQSAVMQVVLNRVRHPAFPSSICATVFQGSDRTTGCQFSFACDGSMRRRQYSAGAWRTASGLARAMLDGFVDARVGLATHYHTDWVVPYWSASLDKLVAVRSHLFLRWRGYWGTRQAFNKSPARIEPVVPMLASRFPTHATASDFKTRRETAAEMIENNTPNSSSIRPDIASRSPQRQASVRRLSLAAGASPGRWALNAVDLCKDQTICRVAGWSDPLREPEILDRTTIALSPPDLIFIKRSRDRIEKVYWSCRRWPQLSSSHCLDSAASTAELLFSD